MPHFKPPDLRAVEHRLQQALVLVKRRAQAYAVAFVDLRRTVEMRERALRALAKQVEPVRGVSGMQGLGDAADALDSLGQALVVAQAALSTGARQSVRSMAFGVDPWAEVRACKDAWAQYASSVVGLVHELERLAALHAHLVVDWPEDAAAGRAAAELREMAKCKARIDTVFNANRDREEDWFACIDPARGSEWVVDVAVQQLRDSRIGTAAS